MAILVLVRDVGFSSVCKVFSIESSSLQHRRQYQVVSGLRQRHTFLMRVLHGSSFGSSASTSSLQRGSSSAPRSRVVFGEEKWDWRVLVVYFMVKEWTLGRPRISVPFQAPRRWVARGRELRGAAKDAASTLGSFPLTSGGLSVLAGLRRTAPAPAL